jgi:hypothetical protein
MGAVRIMGSVSAKELRELSFVLKTRIGRLPVSGLFLWRKAYKYPLASVAIG